MPHTQFGHPELGSCDTTKETEMKKALLASSALLLTAGVAAADVTISGSARMGLEYFSPDVGDSDTRLDARLRFNIDASKETDAGVKFGGRMRMQYDDGDTGGTVNAGYVYAEANAFRVEVGNANTAIDSAGLMYAAEVGTGYYGNSSSYEFANFFGYSSKPYGAAQNDRMGIYTQYQVGDFVARLSWITPDQGDDDAQEEVSISFDYATGPFAVSLAYADNGAGIDGNKQLFLGGQYTINDAYTVGLLYNDTSAEGAPAGQGDTSVITLYGNATFGATTVQAYIASVSADVDPAEDMAYGLGANYDLGGASLGGAVEQNFSGDTIARLGVSFSF